MPQAVVRFGSVGDTSAPLPVAIGAPLLLGIAMLQRHWKSYLLTSGRLSEADPLRATNEN